MTPARTIQDFCDDPIGHYREGATYLVWCHSATLCGSVHWGRSTEEEGRELTQLFDLGRHHSMAAGFDVIMDARATESVDWGAFVVISEFVTSRLEEWRRRIHRQAVLVPPGPSGAVVVGMVPLVGGATFPIRYFPASNEAVAWIDRPDLPAVLEQVTRLVSEIRGIAPVVRALRDHLDHSLTNASIRGAATALGLSPRSLQRELWRAGSQFSVELMRARVRVASRLLERGNEKVEAIARRVGCTSSSQLSAMFRRILGETPLEYRARNR